MARLSLFFLQSGHFCCALSLWLCLSCSAFSPYFSHNSTRSFFSLGVKVDSISLDATFSFSQHCGLHSELHEPVHNTTHHSQSSEWATLRDCFCLKANIFFIVHVPNYFLNLSLSYVWCKLFYPLRPQMTGMIEAKIEKRRSWVKIFIFFPYKRQTLVGLWQSTESCFTRSVVLFEGNKF